MRLLGSWLVAIFLIFVLLVGIRLFLTSQTILLRSYAETAVAMGEHVTEGGIVWVSPNGTMVYTPDQNSTTLTLKIPADYCIAVKKYGTAEQPRMYCSAYYERQVVLPKGDYMVGSIKRPSTYLAMIKLLPFVDLAIFSLPFMVLILYFMHTRRR